MYLKALEVNGFKSFSNKTVIEFNKGITSIVGPNGSGKSNILDAILWVLGEQSYKNIRAKESTDVIFSGGKNKKAKSMAEVSLIVDNEDRYLDIDFTELKITRKIYKSGENEYFINDRKIRLKDINNLFMDTGIGKQAYSIIGQGRVEKIISSSPKDLREIIEEAAGVKRAKIEKESSLKILNDIKVEVEKIEYVEKELESRVGILKTESEKAIIFKNISNKIDTLRYMFLEFMISEKKNLKSSTGKQIEEINIRLEKLEKKYSDDKLITQKLSEKKIDITSKLENFKSLNKNLYNNIEKNRADLFEFKSKKNNLVVEYNEKEKRKIILVTKINEKKDILENSKKELQNIKKELDNVQNNKNVLTDKINKIEIDKKILADQVNHNETKLRNYEVDKIKIITESEDLEKRVFLSTNKIKSLNKEKNDVEKPFLEAKKNITQYELKQTNHTKDKVEYLDKINEISAAIETLKQTHALHSNDINEINYKLEKYTTKQKAYISIIENNETFMRSIKYILKQNLDGVVGAFVNLITIPNGYEQAIQILSGGNFQDIVTKNIDVAKGCLKDLKEKKIGRASFLPLNGIKVFRLQDKAPNIQGVIGFARDIVECDSDIIKVLEHLYGNALIVNNIETGTKISQNGFTDRIVTLDGDLITSRGRMSGGFVNKKIDDLLEKKKELLEIEQKIKIITNEKILIKEKLEVINTQIKTEEEILIENKNELGKLDYEINKFNEEYNNIKMNYNNLSRNIDTITYEINENTNFSTNQSKKIDENKSLIININNYILEITSQLNKNRSSLDKLSESSNHNEEQNQINIEHATLNEKHNNFESRYLEIKEDYELLKKEQTEIKIFQEKSIILEKDLEKKIEDLTKILEEEKIKNTETDKKIDEYEKEKINTETEETKMLLTLKDNERNILLEKKDLEKIENFYSKLKLDIEKLSFEINNINVDITSSEIYKEIENENESKIIEKRILSDEKMRNELGSVNLSSIEEYEREYEKFNTLISQKEDLLNSRKSLLVLIKDIEEEIVGKFINARDEINKNFGYMCKEILNNAKGEIKLQNNENLLETGLELSVKYRNKSEQTLLLLSGGEKSMLAVSFIMAIFMFKPSPFTFFDEIEAALDETNTKKLVKLLNEFTEKSQFILITHNKETMKGSHRLYGVTMNKEIGESRIVSVDI